jgi:uncharacterized membrane protein
MRSLHKIFPKGKESKVAMLGVLLVSLVVFALISWVNHRLFRTYCLDLGYYSQCLWDYAHGRMNQSMIIETYPKPCLASHFDLYLLLFSPLVFIFGTYTLLIVQIAFILIGIYGMYKLLCEYTDNQWIPVFAALSYSFFFGVIHAMAFDYHSDVLIAAALPWFFYFIKRKRYWLGGISLLFILIGKENAGLLMIFVSIGLMWDARKDKKELLVLLCYLFVSVLYTYIVIMKVMPNLDSQSGNSVYGGVIRYTDWGYSVWEILRNVLTHPWLAIKAMFNHPNKVEFFICLLLSGALVAIGKPNYLFMMIPLIAQKMLTFDESLWGISNQYNVIFAPLVIAASYMAVSKFSKTCAATVLSFMMLLMVLGTSFYTMQDPKTWIRRENVAFYDKSHYIQPLFSVTEAKKMMELIPEDASVCASSCFCPHLCFRDTIYIFPHDQMFETEFVLVTQEFPSQDLSVFREGYDTVTAAHNLTLLRKRR